MSPHSLPAFLRSSPFPGLVLVAWLGMAAPSLSAQTPSVPSFPSQGDDAANARAFQLYDTQAVAGWVKDVRQHLDAQRWAEAIAALDTLLTSHSGELLSANYQPLGDESGARSLHAVHEGAASWAARVLLSLPAEALLIYERRYGDQAQRALDQALVAGNHEQLTSVARRWPASNAARAAWWALGDAEVERGDMPIALQAWGRALSLVLGHELTTNHRQLNALAPWRDALAELSRFENNGEGSSPLHLEPGVRLRVEFAVDFLTRAELGQKQRDWMGRSALSLGTHHPDPGPALDHWPSPHSLPASPTHPFRAKTQGQLALFPIRHGSSLIYSTSRTLHAVHAFAGTPIWNAPEDTSDWDRLPLSTQQAYSEAIDYSGSLVQPVCAQGIVVAPLQIPRVFERQENYGELKIIRIVPERRLHAFDAETGDALWDHSPPALWDGESGSIEHRMTVVARPTIIGSMILVPTAMLRGRIELHMACYDLHSGHRLWSTPLVTGQRPINMFGRALKEFTAPPPVVVGDRVIMQTQLGTVCCLDVFTGEILWESLYPQLPFTPGTYYRDGEMRSHWYNTPPSVVENTVIAAPFDSKFMLGFDLDSGSVLWEASLPELQVQAGLSTAGQQLHTFVGAHGKDVFLWGKRLVALRAPRGLHKEAPLHRLWLYPADRTLTRSARPVLNGKEIWLPINEEVHVIQRSTGRLSHSIAMNTRPGNLLLSEGLLVSLSAFQLSAHFVWDDLIDRARRLAAAHPEEASEQIGLATLYFNRAKSSLAEQDYRESVRFLELAQQGLAPYLGTDTANTDPQLNTTLYQILMVQARSQRWSANPQAALRSLKEADLRGQSPTEHLAALLEQQAIVRDRDEAAWLAVLDRLEADHADQWISVQVPAGQQGAAQWKGRLIPTSSTLTPPDSETQTLAVPTGLFVAMERCLHHAGQPDELAPLHTILARYAKVSLPTENAWAWAADRIAENLRHGVRDGYEPYEVAAAHHLEDAVAREDLLHLEEVSRLYPHSMAASRANDLRIKAVRKSGDLKSLIGIVLDPLSEHWSAKSASPQELRQVLDLVDALAERGSLNLARHWMQKLAKQRPMLTWSVDGDNPIALGQLAQQERWLPPPPATAAPPTFDHQISPVGDPRYPSTQSMRPLGSVPPSLQHHSVQDGSPAQSVNVYCDGQRIYAFSDETVPETLWRMSFRTSGIRTLSTLPARFEFAVDTSPGRVHVACIGRVYTLDRETGQPIWQWHSGSLDVVALNCINGVIVVRESAHTETGGRFVRLVGLDAATGLQLWSFQFNHLNHHAQPILGPEHLVLLPTSAGSALIFDLFTGRHTAKVELGDCFQSTAASAWIDGKRLILPNLHCKMRPERNHCLAFDLDNGEQAWRISFANLPMGEMELQAILTASDRHYLHLLPADPGAPRHPTAGLYELNTGLGALANRPVTALSDEDTLVGIFKRGHTQLDSPYVFALRRPDGPREAPSLRGIHLHHGERWSSRLPKFMGQVTGSMPLPSISKSTVALAYKKPTGAPGSRGREAALMFLDRRSGKVLSDQPLDPNLWRSTESALYFSTLGDALILSGARNMEIMK